MQYVCVPWLLMWPVLFKPMYQCFPPGGLDMLRYTHVEDLQWFVKTMGRVAAEDLSEDMAKLTEPYHYFVEFLR